MATGYMQPVATTTASCWARSWSMVMSRPISTL